MKKIIGNEKARLCIERNDKEEWTNAEYSIEELFEHDILGSIAARVKNNDKIPKRTVKYFSIGNNIMDKRTRINAKFRASVKYNKEDDFECVCTYLDISDLYNFIVDLYIYYAQAFNTSITDINIRMIEITIRRPVSFTNKGFINTKVLKQYDLDGQMDFLLHFLKTQKWEISNNKIVFTELINDKYVETLLKRFEKESIIYNEMQKSMIINDCETLGIEAVRKYSQDKIQTEKIEKEKLDEIINNNQEFYSMNLRKYNPEFTKFGNKNSKPIIMLL